MLGHVDGARPLLYGLVVRTWATTMAWWVAGRVWQMLNRGIVCGGLAVAVTVWKLGAKLVNFEMICLFLNFEACELCELGLPVSAQKVFDSMLNVDLITLNVSLAVVQSLGSFG